MKSTVYKKAMELYAQKFKNQSRWRVQKITPDEVAQVELQRREKTRQQTNMNI